MIGALFFAASASAFVYWTNRDSNSIWRADLDGSNVDQNFITSANIGDGSGIAVNASYIYWAEPNGDIARANLDGTGIDLSFISGAGTPGGVALDSQYIYWSNYSSGTIGRATIDGNQANVNPSFITGATMPKGVAVNAGHIYWSNTNGCCSSGISVGRANLDGTNPNQNFIPGGNNINGVAVTGTQIYWANYFSDTIGTANLAGDAASVNQSSIATGGMAVGIAVDQSHIYWAMPFSDAIGMANLDGTNPSPSFLPASHPQSVAVDGLTSGGGIEEICQGSGQMCEPAVTVANGIVPGSDIQVTFKASTLHCSDVAIHLFLDGIPAATTAFVSPGQSTTVVVPIPFTGLGKPHDLTARAEGRVGGCNSGNLLHWHGTFSLVYSPVGAPTINATQPTNASVYGGQTIILKGSGFVPGATAQIVPQPFTASYTMNGKHTVVGPSYDVPLLVASPTQASFVTPELSSIQEVGPANVTVANPGGGSANTSLTFYVSQIGELVVRHKTGDDTSCTASVIHSQSRSMILAAGHCAVEISNATGSPDFDTAFMFAPGYDGALNSLNTRPASLEAYFNRTAAPLGLWAGTVSFPDPVYSYSKDAPGLDPVVNHQNSDRDVAFFLLEPNSGLRHRTFLEDQIRGLTLQTNSARNQEWMIFGKPGTAMLSCTTAFPGSFDSWKGGFLLTRPFGWGPPLIYTHSPSDCGPGSLSDTQEKGGLARDGASGGPWIARSSGKIGAENSQCNNGNCFGAYLGTEANADYTTADSFFGQSVAGVSAAVVEKRIQAYDFILAGRFYGTLGIGLSDQTAQVSGKRAMAVTLRCRQRKSCRGAVTVSVTGAQAARVSARANLVVLGHTRFVIPARTGRKVRLRLTARAITLLRRHHRRLKALMTVVLSPGGYANTKSRLITLRL